MRIDQMNQEMLLAILETLPVEITVIDANDEVAGWNKHETRLFNRPLNSLGMNFRQCHPQESLDRVERIVDELKRGDRDMARFWIDLAVPGDARKHKILIEFYAFRDPSGRYLGCLEVTQDIEAIRALEGEKRLLD
jgi:DUF438 domain-containing protein